MDKRKLSAARAEGDREYARAAGGRRRKRRRKRSYILYYVMLLLFVAAALTTLSLTVLFNITSIEVQGVSDSLADRVVKASNIKQGDNLFRINTDTAVKKILKEVTEVDSVIMEKNLPSKLIIKVSETVAGYNIQKDGKYSLLSKNYRVMDTELENPSPEAITLAGIDIGKVQPGSFADLKHTEGFDTVELVLETAKENGLEGIKEVDVSNVINITLNINNTYKVYLGPISELSYKLKFVKHVIESNLEKGEKGIIDARKEGQLSFKPDEKLYASSDSKNKDSKKASSSKTESSSSKTKSHKTEEEE